tara:strand:- start:518 stop:691 length:174 start_codon:yes stop_codon:yes gene_type:complete
MAIDLRDSIKSGLNSGVRQSISGGEDTIVLIDKFLITQGADQIITQSDDNIIAAVRE